MKPLFQLSTRRYDEELSLVKKAMDDLESNCKVNDGFQIKEPFEKAGWTFFNLELSAEMASSHRKFWHDGKCREDSA